MKVVEDFHKICSLLRKYLFFLCFYVKDFLFSNTLVPATVKWWSAFLNQVSKASLRGIRKRSVTVKTVNIACRQTLLINLKEIWIYNS